MGNNFDLVIRGGTVVDGTGSEPRRADVAVSGGKIVDVGAVSGRGAEEIDAKGLLVTPGFVDVHTHLDGHVTWESVLKPNTGHGNTTVIIGNCGVGFAPCRPEDRDMLIGMMETVEDIPFADLKKGLPWEWESYPEYLEALGRRQYNMDVGALVPHSTLRAYVMRDRAMGETATAADLTQMRAFVREAIRAGALGVGSSTLRDQKTSDGRHIPSFGVSEEEFQALADGMRDAGAGVLQIAFEFNEFPGAIAELEMLIRVARASDRPLMYSLKQSNSHPEGWRELLAITDRANREGVKIMPQVLGRPTGAIMSLASSLNPFVRCPSFQAIANLPLPEKLVALRQPELRAKLLAESKTHPLTSRSGFELLFPLSDPPNYEPAREESILARAESRGMDPEVLAYELMLEQGGNAQMLLAGGNYKDFNLEPSLAMLRNAHAVPGLGDGGAHSAIVCDASISTYMLSYWTRDRIRGDRLPLPYAVKLLTQVSAHSVGMYDRGVISPGMKADLNVIDYDRLTLRAPTLSHDLPAGGARLTQAAEGYVATIVSGEIVHRDDQETGRLPGRVVRGPQSAA
jgi:N-acyl-D-aspartate/D-glutamate deacylase